MQTRFVGHVHQDLIENLGNRLPPPSTRLRFSAELCRVAFFRRRVQLELLRAPRLALLHRSDAPRGQIWEMYGSFATALRVWRRRIQGTDSWKVCVGYALVGARGFQVAL